MESFIWNPKIFVQKYMPFSIHYKNINNIYFIKSK